MLWVQERTGRQIRSKERQVHTKEYVTLNNGVKMPMEGFGVFQVPDPAQCEQAVSGALQAGCRLIDTVAAYMNEEAVGAAIRKSGVDRKDIFLTTKLWVQDFGYEQAKKAIETSMTKLGVDYLDLLLIHQPEALKTMQEYGVIPEAWDLSQRDSSGFSPIRF